MTNWSDPKEIMRDANVLTHCTYALLGVVLWEIFCTFDFEWSIITGRRRFRWPLCVIIALSSSLYAIQEEETADPSDLLLVPFFTCRYCIVFALIGLITADEVTSQVNCQALYTFNSWSGNMTILCASTCLMLRTIALWERKLAIVIPLGAACLAHWILLYFGMFVVKADWIDTACVVTQTDPRYLRVTLFYTMSFDFVILALTLWAMHRTDVSQRVGIRSLLFQDGLVYFFVSFLSNCIPAVFNVLDLNTVMNVVANVPAAAISSIAACRCVIRLQEYYSNTEVFVSSVSYAPGGSGANGGAKIVFRPANRSALATVTTVTKTYGGGGSEYNYRQGRGAHRATDTGGSVQVQTLQSRTSRPEVHVTTEQITTSSAEFPSSEKDVIELEETTDGGSTKNAALV